ncbi:MAG: SRPBCC family protein [Aggregatilineales bacterium]
MLIVSSSKIIPASAARIYAVLADYEAGHRAILPPRYFKDMQVLEGGYGDGTLIQVTLGILGKTYEYTMRVTEPEPGHIIKETDTNTGQYSTFILEEQADGQCRVTIEAGIPEETGIMGVIQRLTQPPLSRRMFNEELDILANYVQTAPANTPISAL